LRARGPVQVDADATLLGPLGRMSESLNAGPIPFFLLAPLCYPFSTGRGLSLACTVPGRSGILYFSVLI